ncbi:hypothetical protein PEC18_01090 [Paucibacter sp. O1-1]|nr:hypothetical protein [Paucibacter sp. O1-1]MDA3824489.1 hypothetical protein [Paucibacter sp. O1-1]
MPDTALQAHRPDRLIGYLLGHVRSHRGPWTAPGDAVRFAGNRALHLAGQNEFEQMARELAAQFEQRLDMQRPIRLAVLTAQEPNAFATAPSKCDGVLLTKGAFDRIQVLALASAYGLQGLVDQGLTEFPLVRTWGGLPVNEETLTAFGSVVAHVMTAVLVYHEIAHLVLGHEWKWRNGLEQDPGEADLGLCVWNWMPTSTQSSSPGSTWRTAWPWFRAMATR